MRERSKGTRLVPAEHLRVGFGIMQNRRRSFPAGAALTEGWMAQVKLPSNQVVTTGNWNVGCGRN